MAKLPYPDDRDVAPEEEQTTHGLLVRWRAGDRQAANALFAQHGPRLARALRAKIAPAVRRRIEIDELIQETLREALGSLDRFEWRSQGAFLAWLLQIALHTLQDWLRQEERRPRMSSLSVGSSDDSARWQPEDEGSTPSGKLAREETESLMERALEQLDEADRDLVIRRAYLGQDYRTLAEDLCISEGAVRMRMSRALYEMSRWAHQQN